MPINFLDLGKPQSLLGINANLDAKSSAQKKQAKRWSYWQALAH